MQLNSLTPMRISGTARSFWNFESRFAIVVVPERLAEIGRDAATGSPRRLIGRALVPRLPHASMRELVDQRV